MRAKPGAILCGLLLTLASSPAPAIDCAKAGSSSEKLICATPALKSADAAMASAYAELKSRLPPPQQALLQTSQKNWIFRRAALCDDGAALLCLQAQTADRLAFLSGARADAPAGAPRLTPVFFYRAGGKGRYEVDLTFPQAAGPAALNALLRRGAEGDRPWTEPPESDSESLGYSADYRIALQTENLVSVVFSRAKVFGGPYPGDEQFTANFNLKTGREAALDDLLRPGARAEAAKICMAQLRRHYGDAARDFVTKAAVEAEIGKIGNWVFEPDRIDIQFDIAIHALGPYTCTLDGKTSAELARPDGPLHFPH